VVPAAHVAARPKFEPDATSGTPGNRGLTLIGVWLAFCLSLATGCDGCRQPERPDESDDDAVLMEFSFGGARPLPHGQSLTQSGIKPGHWFTVGESITSNLADRRGILRHRVGAADGVDADIDSADRPRPDRWLPLTAEYPAVLPRQSRRRLDNRLVAGSTGPFVAAGKAVLLGQFATGSASTLVETGRTRPNLMEPEEYFLVVLSRRPERFAALQTADWVRPPRDDFDLADGSGGRTRRNFRIVFVKPDNWPALSETMLDWTSTSTLLWDDVEPASLTPEQSRALIDWLHFGGRLIVNGPAGGSELTRDRFGPWMPQRVEASEELDLDSLAGLVREWAVPGDADWEQRVEKIRERSGRLGTAGPIDPQAIPVSGTQGLVLTRAVGRGQIVQTRFDLADDWLVDWPSRDSFYNGALLGRPFRQFRLLPAVEGLTETSWESRYPEIGMTAVADARYNTRFRLLARDAKLAVAEPAAAEPTAAEPTGPDPAANPADDPDEPENDVDSDVAAPETPTESGSDPLAQPETAAEPRPDPASAPVADAAPDADIVPSVDVAPVDVAPVAVAWDQTEFASDPVQGIGGWKDDSDFARAAIETLRAGAGVSIPSRRFVVRSLAIYLTILVPLNFFLFWSIGRVEWAWFAIPLIGLLGGLWIARQANLDIGFARSQTEVALMEAHAGYPRAHVTRFLSIYNSLSGRYDLAFDSPDAAAAPLGLLGQVDVDTEELKDVTLRFGTGDGPVLAGVPVASNRARIFHVEQMVDLAGTIELMDNPQNDGGQVDGGQNGGGQNDGGQNGGDDNTRLRNTSGFDLANAIVISRTEKGNTRVANIGELSTGGTTRLRWRDADSSDDASLLPVPLELGIERVMNQLTRSDRFPLGSIRLIATTSQTPSGMSITPESAQREHATVIVVHLRHSSHPAGRPDENLPPEIKVSPTDDAAPIDPADIPTAVQTIGAP